MGKRGGGGVGGGCLIYSRLTRDTQHSSHYKCRRVWKGRRCNVFRDETSERLRFHTCTGFAAGTGVDEC